MSSKQPTIANVMESLKNIESVLSSGQKPSLSTEEAAAYLGITVKSLQTLTHKKQIPYYKPNGKMLYFDRGELDEWQHRNRQAPVYEKSGAVPPGEAEG